MGRIYFLLWTIISAIIVAASPLQAQVVDGSDLFQKVNSKRYSSDKTQGLEAKKASATLFKLSPAEAKKTFLSNSSMIRITNFPVDPVERAEVRLFPIRGAVDERTMWYKIGSSGEKILVKAPAIRTFRGAIKGDKNSEIIITYSDGLLFGSVKRAVGEYYDIVSPEKDEISIAPHNLQNIMGEPPPLCGNEFEDQIKNDFQGDTKQSDEIDDFSRLLQANIIPDVAYSFYNGMQCDYNKTAAYITAIMSYVSLIYERDINVRLYVPEIVIRTNKDKDPYYDVNNSRKIGDDLYKMTDVWQNERADSIANVCLFACYNYPAGGLSHLGYPGIGILCHKTGGYCAMGVGSDMHYPNYEYTWDVSVTAHELGHNFGSPHTHNCYYAPNLIDTCVIKNDYPDACYDGPKVPRPGTIMSYCHLTNGTSSTEMYFHPRQVKEMRKAAFNSSCVKEVEDPYINILSPLPVREYSTNDQLDIRWSYARIKNIDLYYSIDMGNSWIEIAKGIPTNTGNYGWRTPSDSSLAVILKIVDSDNPALYDVTDVPLGFEKPQLWIQHPDGKVSFDGNEVIPVIWGVYPEREIDAYFSSDNGANWELIKSNEILSSFNYSVPNVESEYCYIKLVASHDTTFKAVSNRFIVGSHSFKIHSPVKGDTLCANTEVNFQFGSFFSVEFGLEWSSDCGTTWKVAKLELKNSSTGTKIYWKTPSGNYPNAAFRAVRYYHNASFHYTKELYRVDGICIKDCSVSADEIYNNGSELKILSAAPNPAGDEMELKFYCPAAGTEVRISIVNAVGTRVLPETLYVSEGSENSLKLDLSALPTGRYFAVVKTDGGQAVWPIAVIK